MPWRLVPRPFIHPFNFFSVLAFLSTRRGPCRSEAPSTARAAPGDHKPLIGGVRWRSMGELRLGRIVTRTKSRGTKHQGTVKPRGWPWQLERLFKGTLARDFQLLFFTSKAPSWSPDSYPRLFLNINSSSLRYYYSKVIPLIIRIHGKYLFFKLGQNNQLFLLGIGSSSTHT